MGANSRPRSAAPAGARCSATALSVLAGAVACLYRLVGGPDAWRAAAVVAADRAMGRGRRRAAGAARPRLADVRPHPAQGSRALHPLGRSRCATESAVARSACSKSCRSESRQPHRADDDLAASDAAWRRRDRQARRHHARVRQQQREAAAPRRSARPRRRIRAQRHRRAARRPAARRADRARSWPSSCARSAANSAAKAADFGQQVERARRTHARSRPSSSPRRPTGWPRGSPRSKAPAQRPRRRVGEARSRLLRERSTPCSTGRRRRSTKSAPGSTPSRRRSRRWSSRPRPGIGKAGAEAAEALAANIDHANTSLEGLSSRVAEQERASQRMIAEIDRGLALIDQRFTELASQRRRARQPFPRLADPRADRARRACRAGRARRTMPSARSPSAPTALRDSIDRLAGEIRDGVGTAIGEAQGGADRLAEAARDGAAGNRLDPRRRGRSQRTHGRDRRRRSPSSRTASRRCSRASTTASATPSRS